MSHQLSLQIQNDSSYTLKSYSVGHSWDGHNELLSGNNLANGGGQLQLGVYAKVCFGYKGVSSNLNRRQH
jgi:hypothetical protein